MATANPPKKMQLSPADFPVIAKVTGLWHIPAMPMPCPPARAMPEQEVPWSMAVPWQTMGKCWENMENVGKMCV